MTTGLVAVRRNLTPGAVFFRQRGNIVEYSLDNVSWQIAFVLGTQRPTVPPSVLTLIDDMTINEYISFNNQQFTNNVTINNLTEVLNNPASRIDKNICQASQLLAAAFVAAANKAKQVEHENFWREWAAGQGLAVAAIGFLLVLSGPLGWIAIGAGVTKALTLIGAGLAVSAGASTWFETLRDDTPPMTDEDVELIACYIYRNTKAGTTGKAGIQNALLVNWADLPPVNHDIAVAFAGMFDADPTLYSVWLSGLTDLEVVACQCGGCYELIPVEGEIVAGSGYPLLSGAVRTTPTRISYGGNYKKLQMSFTNVLPEPYINNQVDKVTLNFVTTQYGQLGGQAFTLRVTIGGPGGQFFNRDITLAQLPPAGVQNGIVADFSTVTLQNGVSYVTFEHRTNYVEPTLDPNRETVFTGGEICLRGP